MLDQQVNSGITHTTCFPLSGLRNNFAWRPQVCNTFLCVKLRRRTVLFVTIWPPAVYIVYIYIIQLHKGDKNAPHKLNKFKLDSSVHHTHCTQSKSLCTRIKKQRRMKKNKKQNAKGHSRHFRFCLHYSRAVLKKVGVLVAWPACTTW